ncbi:DUF7832 domain-containing protein [Nocardia goodfellowii]
MTKYDDMSWHYDGDYPDDLDEDAAATHIGMYLAWAIHHGLASQQHDHGKHDLLQQRITPGDYFRYTNTEHLTDNDFTADGNAFTADYYDSSRYLDDYEKLFRRLPSMYHAPDSWETYSRVQKQISKRYNRWIKQHR